MSSLQVCTCKGKDKKPAGKQWKEKMQTAHDRGMKQINQGSQSRTGGYTGLTSGTIYFDTSHTGVPFQVYRYLKNIYIICIYFKNK